MEPSNTKSRVTWVGAVASSYTSTCQQLPEGLSIMLLESGMQLKPCLMRAFQDSRLHTKIVLIDLICFEMFSLCDSIEKKGKLRDSIANCFGALYFEQHARRIFKRDPAFDTLSLYQKLSSEISRLKEQAAQEAIGKLYGHLLEYVNIITNILSYNGERANLKYSMFIVYPFMRKNRDTPKADDVFSGLSQMLNYWDEVQQSWDNLQSGRKPSFKLEKIVAINRLAATILKNTKKDPAVRQIAIEKACDQATRIMHQKAIKSQEALQQAEHAKPYVRAKLTMQFVKIKLFESLIEDLFRVVQDVSNDLFCDRFKKNEEAELFFPTLESAYKLIKDPNHKIQLADSPTAAKSLKKKLEMLHNQYLTKLRSYCKNGSQPEQNGHTLDAIDELIKRASHLNPNLWNRYKLFLTEPFSIINQWSESYCNVLRREQQTIASKITSYEEAYEVANYFQQMQSQHQEVVMIMLLPKLVENLMIDSLQPSFLTSDDLFSDQMRSILDAFDIHTLWKQPSEQTYELQKETKAVDSPKEDEKISRETEAKPKIKTRKELTYIQAPSSEKEKAQADDVSSAPTPKRWNRSTKAREIIQDLMKEGYRLRNVVGSHHVLARGGDHVSIPDHGKTLPPGTLHSIEKEVASHSSPS